MTATATSTAPAPALATAFEGVRLKLLSSGLLGNGGLALTAIGRGDGVSTVALGTAAALARHDDGPVLLIDGTPLGERCAARLGLAPAPLPAGADAATLQQHLRPVPGAGYDLLQLASAPPQAGTSASAAAWSPLWDVLKQRYRHILVDAGSLKSDAPLRWAGWVGHTALVIDTTRVTREMMESLRRELRHSGPELAGFILNKRTFHVPARLYRALS